MAEVRDIREYTIFGEDLEFDRLKRIHKTVGDYRERLLKDHLLQDLLLNEGYKIEENRPVSYHDIGNHVFNRIKTSLHLLAVEKITEIVTRPRIYAVSGPVVIIPGEENEERWETAEGFDAGRIEELQMKTFENPEAMMEKPVLRGSPTDKALLEAAMEAGISRQKIEEYMPCLFRIPFNSNEKYIASFHKGKEAVKLYV